MATLPASGLERPPALRPQSGGARSWTRPAWLRMAVLMGVLLVLYAGWQLAGRPGGARSLIGDVLCLPFDAAAVCGTWIAARRCRPVRRLHRAWILLFAAMVAYIAADAIWTIYEATGHTPYPSPADGLYLASYPLMLWGLLRFPEDRVRGAALARLALDLAVVALGGAAVVIYVLLGPSLVAASSNGLQTAVSVAYPVGDMVLLAGLASIALRRSPRSATGALQLIAAGLACWVAGDLVYGVITLHGTYTGGDPLDLLWIAAMALFAVAGAAQRQPGREEEVRRRAIAPPSWAPYIAVLIGFGLLIGSQSSQPIFPDVTMAITAAALAILVSARQFLAQRDLMRTQRELSHQSLHDALTGLPNRALVIDRAEQMLARAQRSRAPAAAVYLDIDGFKRVNDGFGHAAGDELLTVVAERMRAIVRSSDTVGRMGGDEFVVLVDGPAHETELHLVAERLIEAIRAPVELRAAPGRTLSITASAGIARGGGISADDLLRDADYALYEAKARGRNRYAIFESRMELAVTDLLALELDLRVALEQDRLFLLYQPTFDLATRAMTGVEALLRWHHPGRGIVGPDVFIPIAEQADLIGPIGRWVLDAACRQAAAWNRCGHQLSISVNVSARQLDDDGIVDDVRRALAASGLPPGRLVLEITETALMHDADAASRRLVALKRLGIRIAIDDFGSGYSSLAYLRQFAVDALKIDRAFIATVATSPECRALVRTLVALGKTLGLETLGEGIENEAQLVALRQEGCDLGQGFLFARPMAAQAVEEFLVEAAPLTLRRAIVGA